MEELNSLQYCNLVTKKKRKKKSSSKPLIEEKTGYEDIPYFAYMMITDSNEITYKIHTYVFISKDPPTEYLLHNQGEGCKTTRLAAPDWVLALIIGPFSGLNEAVDFYLQWKKGSRGKFRRASEGCTLAKTYNKIVWYNDTINWKDLEKVSL